MEEKINYDLFAETRIRVEQAQLDKIQSVIAEDRWDWKNSNLFNYFMDRSMIDHVDLGSDLYEFMSVFDCKVAVFKVPAYSYIPWHIDTSEERYCFMNIPLQHYETSMTFYTPVDTIDYTGVTQPVITLPYKSGTPYLMNGKKYHSVINWHSEPRYLISLTSKLLRYTEALDYLSAHHLVERCW